MCPYLITPHAHDLALGVQGLQVSREVLSTAPLGLAELAASTASGHVCWFVRSVEVCRGVSVDDVLLKGVDDVLCGRGGVEEVEWVKQ